MGGVVLVAILALAITFAIWSIRHHTRVVGFAAELLHTPQVGWGLRSDRTVSGTWSGTRVRIRATYASQTVLSVALCRPGEITELDASLGQSGLIEFRTMRSGLVVTRVIACMSEEQLAAANDRDANSDLVRYFTPRRVSHVKTLLDELGWKRVVRTQGG